MFWRERIAKENSTLDMIDELNAAQRRSGQHYSQKGGPILRDDVSDATSEARSVVRSIARSDTRSDTRPEARSVARSGAGRSDRSDTRSEVRSVAPSRAPSGSVYGSQYAASSRHKDDNRSGARGPGAPCSRRQAHARATGTTHSADPALPPTCLPAPPRSAHGCDVDPLVRPCLCRRV